MNTIVPAHVAERYARARIVALSTGNVYPLSDALRGGSRETDPLTPLGEYANAAVGRERVFEFYSQRHHTTLALLRLFYAVELRYGVLGDLARLVHGGEPIPLANGSFNCIWQGDANELVLRALALAASPPSVWNLCHPERFAVRAVGTEAPTALLGNSAALCAQLGPPSVPLETLLRWVAHWVKQGGRSLGK